VAVKTPCLNKIGCFSPKASIDASAHVSLKGAARLLNVSEPTVERANRVLTQGMQELVQVLETEKM